MTTAASTKCFFNFRVDPALHQRLLNLAEQTGRSASFYLRELMAEGIDRLEIVYLSEQRLTNLRAGKTSTIPLSEVVSEYVEG